MPSCSNQLTIAIPSWNRQVRLLSTLESICSQPEAKQVDLLILDNGSDEDYEPVVKYLRTRGQPFKYVRHLQNVGMCANILRCMEEADSAWVWILGDDDPVMADSLAQVLAAIHTPRSEDIICFSEAVQLEDDLRNRSPTIDFQAYLETPSSLMAICGISENVFRRSSFVAALSHGYHYATTLFPHLVVALAIMSKGGKIAFKASTLLQKKTVDAADRWYWPSWDLGVGLLLDLPFLKAGERKKLRAKLVELSTKKALFIHSVAMLAAGFERPFVVYVYTQSSLRSFGVWPTLLSPYTYGMLGAIVAPSLASRVLGLFYRLSRKKVSFSYYTDSMKSKRIN
jgi:glycosyltransferase involved in cell wall biosynthesis